VEASDLGRVIREMRSRFPGRDLLAETMVHEEGVEVIAGAVRDESFGPAVMLGMGGLMTEVYGDRSFALPPLDPAAVNDMMADLKARELLGGFRGFRPCTGAIVDLMIMLGDLALELEAGSLLGEIDLNPVLLTANRAVIIDAKVRRRKGFENSGG
jgi:hypothetical protein